MIGLTPPYPSRPSERREVDCEFAHPFLKYAHAPAHRYRRLLRRRRRALLSDHLRGRRRAARARTRIPKSRCTRPRSPTTWRCIYRDDWQGVAELMLASANKLAKSRRRFPDLPRQHHPPGAAVRPAALAAALAAHRRGRRRSMPSSAASGASASPARAGWSRARSIRRSLRRAASSTSRPNAAEREEINRIIMDELVCSIFKPEAVAYFPAGHRAAEGRGLRRRRARLHRDPADHQRREFAAADARLDAPAGARGAAAGGAGQGARGVARWARATPQAK